MKAKQSHAWWIDTLLFAGFLVAFFLSFTGVDLHQWLGLIGGLLALYQLVSHWDWVSAVSRRLFGKASAVVRLKFSIDILLAAGFTLILATGLVISTWLDLSLGQNKSWLAVHILVSITTLVVLVVKLGLHWRWIANTAKDIFQSLAGPAPRVLALQPVPVSRQPMDRREFLKVIGVAGGASMLALVSASKSLASLQSDEVSIAAQGSSNTSTTTTYYQPGGTQFSSTCYSSSGSCSIRCGKRCSYPGHCPRYADTDNDNRCDFAECM